MTGGVLCVQVDPRILGEEMQVLGFGRSDEEIGTRRGTYQTAGTWSITRTLSMSGWNDSPGWCMKTGGLLEGASEGPEGANELFCIETNGGLA